MQDNMLQKIALRLLSGVAITCAGVRLGETVESSMNCCEALR